MAQDSGLFSFLDHLTFVDDDSSSYEIGITDNGFSYLDMGSEKKAKRISFEEKQGRQTSAALDGSTRAHGQSNIAKIETVDHDAICFDTSLDRMIKDVQERKKKLPLLPFAFGIVLVLVLLWLSLPGVLKILLGLLLFPGSVLLLWNVWKLDLSRRHVKFAYKFSEAGNAAFRSINNALDKFSSSKQILYYSGKKHFSDTRYSGGAKSLPVFASAKLDRRTPPLSEMDMEIWHIRAPHRDIYFMPDHLLVFDGGQIGGISYSKLKISSRLEETQARDIAYKTSDSKVVGNTWRFVNNDGTPDKRFNKNTEVPILEYGVLNLSSNRFEMIFYTSLQKASVAAPEGFTQMKTLAGKPTVAVAQARKQQHASGTGSTTEVYKALMDAMCCVMVVDGVVKHVEKQKIHEAMNAAKASWNEAQITSHINEFIGQVKTNGFQAVLSRTCRDLKFVKRVGKERVVLHAIDMISTADGVVDDKELKICDKLRLSLG